ncbi:hypothetical protein [Deinococcus fonticola]|uniref:hypothetical protein n=1 Tax=Deinococcus fonticola TaxID=2528713 RepID=UPI001075704B|nr:hypothetical protein [Deinococcus fonticola]
MSAASPPVPPSRPAHNYSGLWTFLRLLGGWLTVAALAYLLWMPGEDFGWTKMMFVWILLTLVADEFAGWFGYMGLALGVLPFLYAGTPEQWFVIFPLIGGALFALLILKHAGGPFVLPFGAALFAGAILGAAKFGVKLDPSLKLPLSRSFQEVAILPMLGVVAFSFVRQLISMIVRGSRRRHEARAARASAATIQTVNTAATPMPSPAPKPVTPPVPAETTLTETSTFSAQPEVRVEGQPLTTKAPEPNATMIDLDLDHLAVDDPPRKN